MISLEELDELIFGEDGFQNDVTSPLEGSYWKVKINSLAPLHKYIDDDNSFCDNPIFNSINYTSGIAILYLFFEDTYTVLQAGRYNYFSLRIKDVLEKLLSNLSKSIRINLIDSTESIRKKLRWYLFKLNNICKKYADEFELLLEADDVNKSVYLVNATNYLITYYFRNILVKLYTQLLYVDNPSNVEIHNDSLIKEILRNEHDYINTYKHIGDQIENLLSENSPKLSFIYPVIKRHILHFSKRPLFFLGKYEKQLVILVENFIFIILGLHKILSDVSTLNSGLKTSLSFEEIYSMVENEISNFLLPNDRLNYIQTAIHS